MTRLSVNINDDCAAHLAAMVEQGVTATEVVRQALALHKFVQDGGVILPRTGRAPNADARAQALLADLHDRYEELRKQAEGERPGGDA